MTWQDRALCVDVDPVVMQPDRATREEVKAAIGVCTYCPVRQDCHDAATTQASAYGVWAGQWWGEYPVWEVERVCQLETCGQAFRTLEVGQKSAAYCSPGCRVAAFRARNKVSA